jgi:hypothetical protein
VGSGDGVIRGYCLRSPYRSVGFSNCKEFCPVFEGSSSSHMEGFSGYAATFPRLRSGFWLCCAVVSGRGA